MPKKIEISHRTIIFTVFVILSYLFISKVADIILQFFVALLIMTILNPLVTRLSKYKIPRAASVLLAYLILFGVVGFSISAIVPPLAEQTTSFINNLPQFINNLGFSFLINDQVIQQLVSQVAALPSELAKLTVSLFSNAVSVVAVLVFAFYLLLERDKLDTQLGHLFGQKKRQEVGKFIDLLEKSLGGWARAQLTLMLIIGTASYIGLRLIGIPFALPLAILAGVLEIVPYIGPVVAAVPAVLIGFGLSPLQGIAVGALAFLIQQLENYLFVPKIMQKSAGVSPIVTLFALAIGFRLAGIVGFLIAIPIFIALRLVIAEYYFSGKLSEKDFV
jgi:predicted PurR-regulated permease PerM